MPSEPSLLMVKRCPKGAMVQERFNAPTIDQSKCVKCGLCIKTCPYSCFQPD